MLLTLENKALHCGGLPTLEAMKGADRPFLMSINQVTLIQVTDAEMRGFMIFLCKYVPTYFNYIYIFRGMACGLPAQPFWSTFCAPLLYTLSSSLQ